MWYAFIRDHFRPVKAPSSIPKREMVQGMFAAIAGRYDLANHLLSGGMDFLWRRRAARIVQAWNPARLLDLATGSGDLALALRSACPGTFIVGADFCHPMLLEAQRKDFGRLVVADGLRLPFAPGAFEAVTIAFGLRNMESWPAGLAEMHRVLAPGGHLLVLDFSVPPPPLRYLYRPYLRHVLPWLAAFLTGERSAYDYLGDSIEKFPQGDAMCALIRDAGFAEARCTPLTAGIVSLYTARKP